MRDRSTTVCAGASVVGASALLISMNWLSVLLMFCAAGVGCGVWGFLKEESKQRKQKAWLDLKLQNAALKDRYRQPMNIYQFPAFLTDSTEASN